MFKCDEDLILKFHMTGGHSNSTIKTYTTAFNLYRNFHNMSLTDLLNEALLEQNMNVALNKIKLYDRIISFREYLIENYVGNTISSTISRIKTFYKYNRVTLPYIPPLNLKTIQKHEFIAYKDLLTKDEIRDAIAIADDDLKMWILVMLSSGSSRREAKSLTNEILFKGTYTYHEKDNFEDALTYLSKHDNVVCTCMLTRRKTDKPYYTFLNPETVQFIAKNKLKNEDFDLKESLLKYSPDYIGKKFRTINDSLDFGYAGGYRRFRPHMLRKFNATHLNQNLKNPITMDIVDNLQGRSKGKTRESYFKDNPEFLKIYYVQCMNNVSLFHHYTYDICDGGIIIHSHSLKKLY